MRTTTLAALFPALLAPALLATPAAAQQDVLPDIIVDEQWLYDHYVSGSNLRLSNGTANIGPGAFHLFGGADNGDGTQEVWQRVYRTDGSHYDRLASNFVYHPSHGHIHVENWASYRLREVLAGDGVGDIVAQGEKTSFCILDLGVYDNTLPNFDPNGRFFSCNSQTQGLSVGWIDVYSAGLEGQSIPIAGLPSGEYWLESVVDPDDNFLEADKANNTVRIKITLGDTPGELFPDDYEPNDTQSETASRPIAAPNSPNLGPVGPQTTIADLTIDSSSDKDFFRFYNPATGTGADFVGITFSHAQGDLDMRLRSDAGSSLATSQGTGNSEVISLSGRAAGWYVVEVYGFNGDTSPGYDLTINPSANAAPSISVINPPAGDIELVHGADNYTVTWSASDPESNPTWVTIYANTTPALDGNEIVLPTGINVPGAQGLYVINSAYLAQDTYWFYASVTDGGSHAGAWSQGTVTFTPFCLADLDGDGKLTLDDLDAFIVAFASSDLLADLSGDGQLTLDDVDIFITVFTDGCP